MDAARYFGSCSNKTTLNNLIEWIMKKYPGENGIITVECSDPSINMIEIAYENGKVEDMYEKFGFKEKQGRRHVINFEATKYGRTMKFNFDVYIE